MGSEATEKGKKRYHAKIAQGWHTYTVTVDPLTAKVVQELCRRDRRSTVAVFTVAVESYVDQAHPGLRRASIDHHILVYQQTRQLGAIGKRREQRGKGLQ